MSEALGSKKMNMSLKISYQKVLNERLSDHSMCSVECRGHGRGLVEVGTWVRGTQ